MQKSNFTKLRERTTKAYTKIKDFGAEKTNKILDESLKMQVKINDKFNLIEKDYKKNHKLYTLLYDEVMLLRRKKSEPKFDKIKNIFDRDRSGSGKGGGLLGAITTGLSVARMILKPLISKLTKDIGKMIKGLGSALTRMLKSAGGIGKKVIQGVTRSAAGRAVGAAAVNIGKSVGRVAVGTVARFIGAGVVGAAASAVGYPLLIASAAAAVGYGTYKLGRYLQLSEKLDDFIKKVSSGKYRDLGDFILGMVDGTIGKDLYVWVKDKISTLFTDAILYLKDKTNDILGKWSPFTNDPDTQSGGASDDINKVDENANSGTTVTGGEPSDSGTSANDEFRERLSGGSAGIKTDMMSAAADYTSDTPTMMQGVDGYTGNNNTGPDAGGKGLAYSALTNGANTAITSRFGPRKGSSKVSSNHSGIDIKADIGTPLYAPESGTITQSTHERGGLQAHLKGKSGVVYGLAHLSSVNAKGEVKAGELIAKSGNSGKGTTGPHIHFSVKRNGKHVNPEGFLIPQRKSNTKADSPKSKGKGDEGDVSKEKINSASSRLNAAIGSGEDETSIENIKGAKEYTYANSFTTLSSSNSPSGSSELSSSTGISSAKRNAIKAPTQQAASQSSSKAGSIEGKVPGVKDPRGALNKDVMMASISPLFV